MHIYACLVLTVAYPFDSFCYPYAIIRRIQGEFNEVTRLTVSSLLKNDQKIMTFSNFHCMTLKHLEYSVQFIWATFHDTLKKVIFL